MSSRHQLLRGPAAAELRKCSTGGCSKNAIARGLCNNCYASARRRGDLPSREQKEKLEPHKTWLGDEDDKMLRKMAREGGRSCSDIIRQAVGEYFERIRAQRPAT